MKRRVKAWVVVTQEDNLDEIFQGNGQSYQANVFPSRKEARLHSRENLQGLNRVVVPCTIEYEMPSAKLQAVKNRCS